MSPKRFELSEVHCIMTIQFYFSVKVQTGPKFQNPSKDTLADSQRKKHLSNGTPFLLGELANGTAQTGNGSVGNGGLNITTNPIDALNMNQRSGTVSRDVSRYILINTC